MLSVFFLNVVALFIVMLDSTSFTKKINSLCIECCYDVWHFPIVMLSAIMPDVVILNVMVFNRKALTTLTIDITLKLFCLENQNQRRLLPDFAKLARFIT